jgi:hypothetical protein
MQTRFSKPLPYASTLDRPKNPDVIVEALWSPALAIAP